MLKMSETNFSVQGYNLVKLLKRLEDATARLEDVTIYQESYVQSKFGGKEQKDSSKTPEAVSETPAETPAAVASEVASAPEPAKVEEAPKAVIEFEQFIATNVDPLVELSKEIDPAVEKACSCRGL